MIKEDKIIALKINNELLTKLKLKATQEDRSLSSIIRIAITEYLKIKK